MNENENRNNQEPKGQAPGENPAGNNADPQNNQTQGQSSGGQFQGWQSYHGDSQQTGSQNNGGFQNFGSSPSQNQNTQGTEYQWNFEDYDRISKGPEGAKPKSNTGLKIFAVVMTVVFLITAAAFAGFIVFQTQRTQTLESSQVTEESSRADGPQLSLNNRPAPDEEEYTDGVLSTE